MYDAILPAPELARLLSVLPDDDQFMVLTGGPTGIVVDYGYAGGFSLTARLAAELTWGAASATLTPRLVTSLLGILARWHHLTVVLRLRRGSIDLTVPADAQRTT